MKKLEYRYMFDKLYEEIIEILNMTDTAKLTQFIEIYKEDPVFSLKVDRMQFNIDLDSQFELDYVFLYIQQDKINKMEIMYPQWVIHGGDPDEDLNWDLRDKKIVRMCCLNIMVIDFASITLKNSFGSDPESQLHNCSKLPDRQPD
jgi:hypothetical protein